MRACEGENDDADAGDAGDMRPDCEPDKRASQQQRPPLQCGAVAASSEHARDMR